MNKKTQTETEYLLATEANRRELKQSISSTKIAKKFNPTEWDKFVQQNSAH
ncbi:MAG: hypothetical protein LKG31_01010 [Lactobacillus sp.]|nr:hypothetical protein [Lactobacillus sp.]